jgi:hypothetical protein
LQQQELQTQVEVVVELLVLTATSQVVVGLVL